MAETLYHQQIWRTAVHNAEQEVMRLTATPTGGREKGETLAAYIERTRKSQDAAMARYLTAVHELKDAGGDYLDTWPK